MINLKGYNFLFGKKAVSPVIGTILMVAVTVIMAAVVGGFVYQTARPKIPPAVSTSLADDPLVAVNANAGDAATPEVGSRVAKLYFEGGQNIAIAELSALVTFTTNNSTAPEVTAILDGVYWDDNITAHATLQGRLMKIGTADAKLWLVWADNDGSLDITPGDRLDFYETDGVAAGEGVKAGRDFTVKILHKATQAFVADHTIRVY